MLGSILLALLAAGGFLYWKSNTLAVKTDPQTLCRTDQAPPVVLAILLDVSDELAEPQLLKIEHEVQRVRGSLPKWGRVETYMVARGGERLAAPFIVLCNPGDGSDMSEFYENPAIARRRWEAFNDEFGRRLRAVMGLPDTDSSPILESIQAVALRTFDRPEFDSSRKQLVVVSDLIQNVPNKMNQYKAIPTFDEFAGSDYYSQVRADLHDVDVSLAYLNRSTVATQGTAHIAFWERYFAAQGATVQVVTRVFGDK